MSGKGMKRLRRNIVGALTALSLVLCLGSMLMWVRSYWVQDSVRWNNRQGKETTIGSSRGKLGIGSFTALTAENKSASRPFYKRDKPSDLDWSTIRAAQVNRTFPGGRYLSRKEKGFEGRGLLLSFPLIVALTGLAPGILAGVHARRRMIHGRRVRLSRCADCGYDLRATPERCPECGAIPAKAEA